MIDVSQAVEHEHPYALEFLRKDCTNITGEILKKFLNSSISTKQFDFRIFPP